MGAQQAAASDEARGTQPGFKSNRPRASRLSGKDVGRTGMLTTNLKQMSAVGWLLAAVALTSTVLVSIPLGAWALDAIDRSTFRAWRDPIICLLAVPPLGAAVITFWVGARFLRRLGIDVQKHGSLGAQQGAAADERPQAGARG